MSLKKWIYLIIILLLVLPSCSGINELPTIPDEDINLPINNNQTEIKQGTLIEFCDREMVEPVWIVDTSGGATWQIDKGNSIEGGSSLKITLPRGSSFEAQFRIYNLPNHNLWDLSGNYFNWWFKIDSDAPVNFRENSFGLINSQHETTDSYWLCMDRYWAHSTDWIQFTATSGIGSQDLIPSEIDRIIVKVQNLTSPDDGGYPGTSDCTVWLDCLTTHPNYAELPVATFTLDDGYLSWQRFGAILDEYGFKGCFNVTTSGYHFDNDAKDVYMELMKNGHEIASHSFTHAVTEENIWEELIKSRLMLQEAGLGPCRFFAKPGGASKWKGDMFNKIGEVYAGYRNTVDCSSGVLFPQAVTNIGRGTDDQIRDWIISQIKQRNWIMLYGHAMDGDPEYSGYSDNITEDRLRFICELLLELGVPVKTYSEVATEERFPTPSLRELFKSDLVKQRIGPCNSASSTSVHHGINLTNEQQVITTNITNPDVYRCVQIISDRPTSMPTRARFTGSGLDDLISGGIYLGIPDTWWRNEGTYWVEIVSEGTTDAFRWSFNQGENWYGPLAIIDEPQLLSDGITVKFNSTSGHTVGDTWAFEAVAAVKIVGENWDGFERIESIYLTDDTSPIYGKVPFITIKEIYVPAEPNGGLGHSVSIGCCDRLGLYNMMQSSLKPVEVKRKPASASVYTIEHTGIINAYYGTVDVGVINPIVTGDSFEFTYSAL